jgi:hypothetical protein
VGKRVLGVVVRLCLIGAAVWWWSLLLHLCSNVPQLDIAKRQTIPFACPVGGLAFITPVQRVLLFGLVPLCLVLTVVDVLGRRHR